MRPGGRDDAPIDPVSIAVHSPLPLAPPAPPMNHPAQTAHVPGHDNIVVQASGSGVAVAVGPQPHLRLTQYERRTKLAARDNSEAALLSAYRITVGRIDDPAAPLEQ